MNIWRLNVNETQIDACITNKLFALSSRPNIQEGDLLLLQLNKANAIRTGKNTSRIEYALIFDHYEEDYDGSISRNYWPVAGKTWDWILHCSDIIALFPFSLEYLNLDNDYSGQTNPRRILNEDQSKILPFILRCLKTEQIGQRVHDISNINPAGYRDRLWAFINNNDRIVEKAPDKINWESVAAHKAIKRNPELPIVLKEIYGYKCQICGFDFRPDYGMPYSETHHILWLSRGGVDHSNNMIVICPNHHRIIHEAQPEFDRRTLAFRYPNGLLEHLQLKEHFKDPILFIGLQGHSKTRLEKIQAEKS